MRLARSILLLAALATPAFASQSDDALAVAPEGTESSGFVARASFATAIQDREPVDSVTTLATDQTRVFYFTELRELANRVVTHRWEYRGEQMAEVVHEIGGPRWRVYSSKNLDPSWVGEWTVSVVDEDDNVLQSDVFVYQAAAAPHANADEEPAETVPASLE